MLKSIEKFDIVIALEERGYFYVNNNGYQSAGKKQTLLSSNTSSDAHFLLGVNMRGRVNDLTGVIFGKQLVLERAGSDKFGNAVWKMLCSCGNIREVSALNLKNSYFSKSCRFCMNKKHGYNRTNKRHYLYRLWAGMKDRCSNKKSPIYSSYGGRGIKFCKAWINFIPFKNYIEKHLGDRPKKHTLDRINNDGNYEPGNVRWATKKQQANNRRKPHV